MNAEKEAVNNPNYYITDAISDEAVKMIQGADKKKPIFLYLAYTAAHWPLHAKPEDIAAKFCTRKKADCLHPIPSEVSISDLESPSPSVICCMKQNNPLTRILHCENRQWCFVFRSGCM